MLTLEVYDTYFLSLPLQTDLMYYPVLLNNKYKYSII